jgi:hypothetical protein
MTRILLIATVILLVLVLGAAVAAAARAAVARAVVATCQLPGALFRPPAPERRRTSRWVDGQPTTNQAARQHGW